MLSRRPKARCPVMELPVSHVDNHGTYGWMDVSQERKGGRMCKTSKTFFRMASKTGLAVMQVERVANQYAASQLILRLFNSTRSQYCYRRVSCRHATNRGIENYLLKRSGGGFGGSDRRVYNQWRLECMAMDAHLAASGH